MAKNFRLAGRTKAQDFEWLKWGFKRPELEEGLWLVDWRSIGSPKYCVYVIAPDGQWPVKIGISHSPVDRSRLGNLQVGNWKRLEVAHCFWTETQADALAIEKEVHRDYSEQKKWLLGEWVDTRPNEARERIEWAALILGVNIGNDVPSEAAESIKARIETLWPWTTYYQAMAERGEMSHRGTISADY